ncbi:MAG: DUF2971 domain-containing protein [Rhodospirillaceae bacterium]|nr:DUF2971 domain-containing protein [Rhodospirillales bacterium]
MLLYHYCSNDTFLKILVNRELWLSELTLSNDSMEGEWVRKLLLDECHILELPEFIIDSLLCGVEQVLALTSAAGFCLSENADVLSQWRGYADNGAGVAIGFDREYLVACGEAVKIKSKVNLSKIEYNVDVQRSTILSYMNMFKYYFVSEGELSAKPVEKWSGINCNEQIKLHDECSNFFFPMRLLSDYLFTLKNPAFAEESEWRLYATLFKSASFKIDGTLVSEGYADSSAMNFRSCGERIVPYLNLPLGQLGSVKEVVLGPRNQTPDVVVRTFLIRMGVPHVAIRRSAATYR